MPRGRRDCERNETHPFPGPLGAQPISPPSLAHPLTRSATGRHPCADHLWRHHLDEKPAPSDPGLE
ncbi:hypothetical protein LX36DRAFT_664531 [Colletotrichum falcatum]|nr:hypothetical protein LX36DRAFT_664531 [Colletotrichum falcatum]